MDRKLEFAVDVKDAYKVYSPDFIVLDGFNMKVPSGCMYVYIYILIHFFLIIMIYLVFIS